MRRMYVLDNFQESRVMKYIMRISFNFVAGTLLVFIPFLKLRADLGDIKVAPELSIGISPVTVGQGKRLKEYEFKGYKKPIPDDAKIESPPILFSVGLFVGYNLLGFIEPEIGFKYRTTQKIKIERAYNFEESMFLLPLRLNFYLNIIPLFLSLKAFIGYQFNFIHSAKWSGDEELIKSLNEVGQTIRPSLLVDKSDLQKSSDYPKGGDLLLGLGFETYAGIYVNIELGLPVLDVSAINITKLKEEFSEKDPLTVKPSEPGIIIINRILTKPWLNFQLGANMMKWFF